MLWLPCLLLVVIAAGPAAPAAAESVRSGSSPSTCCTAVRGRGSDLPRGQRWIDPPVALRADIQTPASVVAVFSTHTPRDDCQTRRKPSWLASRTGARPS